MKNIIKRDLYFDDLIRELPEACRNVFRRSDFKEQELQQSLLQQQKTTTKIINNDGCEDTMSQKRTPADNLHLPYIDSKDSIIIFIDFYGVLNSENTYSPEREKNNSQRFHSSSADTYDLTFSNVCIENLNTLLDTFNTHISVISTWRAVYQPLALEHILRSFGLHIERNNLSIINNDPLNTDIACSIQSSIEQLYQIETKKQYDENVEVPPFIIFDDGKYNMFKSHFGERHFEYIEDGWINGGLNTDHVYSAMNKIKRQIQIKEQQQNEEYRFKGLKKPRSYFETIGNYYDYNSNMNSEQEYSNVYEPTEQKQQQRIII